MADSTNLKCSDCGEDLEPEAFADNPAIGRGKDYICKRCTRVNRMIKRYSSRSVEELRAELTLCKDKVDVIEGILACL